jgi:LacI family transcriptional regulator
MPTTLKDVAKRVGKSVPTVSRALGGFPDISPRTRAEVQRVAQEMGYEPSATATNLKKKAGKRYCLGDAQRRKAASIRSVF